MALIDDIIYQGMREAGQYTITRSQTAFTEFQAYQWPTIKSEIWNASRTDRILEKYAARTAFVGTYNLNLPSDYDNVTRIWLFDAPDTHRGTAQGATANTLTLASSFSDDELNMRGRWLFILTSTGLNQARVISSYNDTTKVATVETDWGTTPDNTPTYLIGVQRHELRRCDYAPGYSAAARPTAYARQGNEVHIYPTADKNYGLLFYYQPNLTLMSETDVAFLKHLAARRALWVQGVKVRTAARYDDERYGPEKAIWERMLSQYAGQNTVYRQMEGSR